MDNPRKPRYLDGWGRPSSERDQGWRGPLVLQAETARATSPRRIHLPLDKVAFQYGSQMASRMAHGMYPPLNADLAAWKRLISR